MSSFDRCCPEDFGGTHWHCGYCGCVSGYQGHVGKNGNTTFCPPLDKRPSWATNFVMVDTEGNLIKEYTVNTQLTDAILDAIEASKNN